VPTIVNAQTGQTVAPAISNFSGFELGTTGTVDFYASATDLTLYFMGDAAANSISMNSWDRNTGQVTPIASDPNLWQINPQTDGVRVPWETTPRQAQQMPPYTLVAANVGSTLPSTLSTNMTQFQLADSLLVWTELNSADSTLAIKVSDGSTITTVSSRTSTHFFGTGGGYVLFAEDSMPYVWGQTTGKQLLLESIPGMTPGIAMINGKVVRFLNGKQQLLYAITLQ
jgi:hypothetical protein